MPFIYVKTLPFDPPMNAEEVVEGITQDFANETGIGLEHVTATCTQKNWGVEVGNLVVTA